MRFLLSFCCCRLRPDGRSRMFCSSATFQSPSRSTVLVHWRDDQLQSPSVYKVEGSLCQRVCCCKLPHEKSHCPNAVESQLYLRRLEHFPVHRPILHKATLHNIRQFIGLVISVNTTSGVPYQGFETLDQVALLKSHTFGGCLSALSFIGHLNTW